MNIRGNLAMMRALGVTDHPLQQQELQQDPAFWSGSGSKPANDLEATRRELAEKSLQQIQRETAFTWARRAAVAFENAAAGARAGNQPEHFRWSLDAMEYEHEALEHAALADNGPALTKPSGGFELPALPEVKRIIGAGKGG